MGAAVQCCTVVLARGEEGWGGVCGDLFFVVVAPLQVFGKSASQAKIRPVVVSDQLLKAWCTNILEVLCNIDIIVVLNGRDTYKRHETHETHETYDVSIGGKKNDAAFSTITVPQK